ncbi:murein transglycosylase A [Sphingomonas sp. QA11]|uniref:murein transglycosylase A n=1 Tax=Sphingomonas sp. QA11 TaxID=2950605 RepID=UPI00234A966E|nr:murein transglycosylase A [Sphingomonas sp. QA11]WCM29847.1 murein transglycosylase A [Sphingomonas sp. QA11]
MLSACGGGVVPRPGVPSSPGVPPSHAGPPVRRPVAATPIAPAPAVPVPGSATAAKAGLVAGPPLYSLPINEAQAARALAAFRISCATLQRRTDASGLTRGTDWQPACAAASTAGSGDARAFFAQWFETVQVGDGKAFATGYYEPEIIGSRDRRRGYDVPIYGRPSDLVDVDLGQFSADLKGKKVRGRVDGSNFVPYFDRTAIEQGMLAQRAPIIAWAADPVELFFLQIQGSGRLRLPDGSVMRIGYDSQNGRDYTGIGALMRERGLLAPGQTSMQGIVAWLHAHPEEGRAIMRENKSYVFFREQQGAPLGALGLPVTGGVSAAADPRFVPLGAPVFLSMDRTDATGLWIAQDTGGAIRGSNRFDTFWGAGDDARAIAGGMSARGTAFLLLPVGTLARLTGGGGAQLP